MDSHTNAIGWNKQAQSIGKKELSVHIFQLPERTRILIQRQVVRVRWPAGSVSGKPYYAGGSIGRICATCCEPKSHICLPVPTKRERRWICSAHGPSGHVERLLIFNVCLGETTSNTKTSPRNRCPKCILWGDTLSAKIQTLSGSPCCHQSPKASGPQDHRFDRTLIFVVRSEESRHLPYFER